MPKRVLDAGNCVPDHTAIRELITSNFDADVDQAHTADEAVELLNSRHFDLVLVNRVFDRDGSDGFQLIRRINELATRQPVMLLTNFPEHQQAAIDVGAVPGFGKAELRATATHEKLASVLCERAAR